MWGYGCSYTKEKSSSKNYTIYLLASSWSLEADQVERILATSMASISRALYSGQDYFMGHSLTVLCQAQEAHEVDETSGKVQLAAKLTCCIVIGKRVVIVVKSLTWKAQETLVNNW